MRGLPFIWHRSWISNPSYQINPHLCRKWDQRFESALLQQRDGMGQAARKWRLAGSAMR
jgi:hypothetical protein